MVRSGCHHLLDPQPHLSSYHSSPASCRYSAQLLHADGYQRLAHDYFYIGPTTPGCYHGSDAGESYRGNVAVTNTGKTCQDWLLDTPHAHSHNHHGFGGNYCRNPDGSSAPWCYTTDPSTRWEYCDQIALCTDPPPSPPSPPAPPPPPHAPYGPSMAYCSEPENGDTKVVDTADQSAFDTIDDAPISEACVWTYALGIGQTSNAWGNSPGDNTLTGCNALYKGREFKDFIMETDMVGFDNDGVGFNFGWKGDPVAATAGSQRYIAAMINDQWPNPPADGVGGPHMKIKRMNGKPCTEQLMGTNNCFDTLAFLNGNGHHQVNPTAFAASGNAASAGVHVSLPSPYASTYRAYPMEGEHIKLTLIVKDLEARMFWTHSDGTVVGVSAQLPSSYTGGKVPTSCAS